MTVVDWPAYLLKGIPAPLAHTLLERAVELDVSVNDVIRQALCRRYRMECDPESTMHVARYLGSDTILLRIQPEVYKRIKKETGNEYGAVRRLILDTLEADLKGA